MPSYRPPISRDEFHQLEAYRFRLVMFTGSFEFKDLKSQQQMKIMRELAYMDIAIDIMTQLFSVKGGTERPVVGWMEDSDEPYTTYYRFSCIKTAALSIGGDPSKIALVCKGLRKSTGGVWEINKETGKKEWVNSWCFQYQEDFEEDQNYTFDPNNTKFEFK
jgi:hypothetical protein